MSVGERLWGFSVGIFAGWCIFGAPPAKAHDYWSTGQEVPVWVKQSCCGQADAHKLKGLGLDVHEAECGGKLCYRVDGFNGLVPYSSVLPSQDGDWWIFYREAGQSCPMESGKCEQLPQSQAFCFFVPMSL